MSKKKKKEKEKGTTTSTVHNTTTESVNQAATPKYQPPVEIRVVDCCGVFGYLIPWARWKAVTPPIVPTRDTGRPYIYLYSGVGQLDLSQAMRYTHPGSHAILNMVAMVDMDPCLNWNTKEVDWSRVFSDIMGIALQKWPKG